MTAPVLRTAVALAVLTSHLTPLRASDTPPPSSVTVPASFQTEVGCAGDWDPSCAATHLTLDLQDQVWQGTFSIPAGSWEYKAALNDAWDENYGLHGTPNGASIPLTLASPRSVKFYYDHETHWITDNVTSVVAVAAGSFQSELGCSGDWQPDCLRSWLEDPDGDGTYTFISVTLPAGDYETKVAVAESWSENYGAGGVLDGPNIPFTVPADCTRMLFSYNGSSHVLTVAVAGPPAQPNSVTVVGSLQEELGCSGDWQPACAATHLSYDATDQVWQGTFNVPAGSFEYKVALNDAWDENYGLHATPNGASIALTLASPRGVKFYFDHETHWVADAVGSVIATAPGSYQSELGCPGDWQPDCLRSWLQDPDGDGILTFDATLPAGDYEAKIAVAESWDENYGAGGVANGPNIAFTSPAPCVPLRFSYNSTTHVLTIAPLAPMVSTTTTLTSYTNPALPGATITLAASVTPATATGTLTLSEGAVELGTTTLGDGGVFLINTLPSGTHTLTVSYAGDAFHLASTSPPLDQVVYQLTTTALQSSLNPAPLGAGVTFTATVTPAAATGTVSFREGAVEIGSGTLAGGVATFATSALSAGSHTILARYSGDGLRRTSDSAALTQLVTQPTTTGLASSLNPSAFGDGVTFTATVSPVTATGSLSFREGAIEIGSGTLAAGVATFMTSALGAGTHTLTAHYAADPLHQASTSPPLDQVVSQAGTTTLLEVILNPTTAELRATVTPSSATGSVAFLVDGSTVATVHLTGGLASTTVPRQPDPPAVVSATYSGDANHAGSTSADAQILAMQLPVLAPGGLVMLTALIALAGARLLRRL